MTMVPSPSAAQVFTFPETAQPVRSLMVDGNPWWVARDLGDVLELGNMHSSLALLEDDEKGVHSVETPGGLQQMATVNESGLYSLILRSRKPQAKAFKRWITGEVLPAIRRTGSYSVAPSLPQDFEEALVALLGQVRENKELTSKVAELEPAAHSWEVLASGDGDFSVSDAAKILARDPSIKLGRGRLFTYLGELKWTYRQIADGCPRAMQYPVEHGWLSELPQSHYHPRTGDLVLDAPQVRVTVKGLKELHKRLGGTQPAQIPTVPSQRGLGGAR